MTTENDDRSFFESLVRRHSRELYGFARRLCGENETAEDLVQETYAETWKSIGRLKDKKAARAWLFQILRHRYSRWFRTVQRRPETVQSIDQNDERLEAVSEDVLTLMADQELLQIALDRLNPDFKMPLLMVMIEGMTCREAAKKLDVPVGTVLSRLHRARTGLRRIIQQIEQRDPLSDCGIFSEDSK